MTTNTQTSQNGYLAVNHTGTEGSLLIFDKLGVRLTLSWNKRPDGVWVAVRSANGATLLGEGLLRHGESTRFMGSTTPQTGATVELRMEPMPARLYFSAKAIQRPEAGNWQCAGSKEQILML